MLEGRLLEHKPTFGAACGSSFKDRENFASDARVVVAKMGHFSGDDYPRFSWARTIGFAARSTGF